MVVSGTVVVPLSRVVAVPGGAVVDEVDVSIASRSAVHAATTPANTKVPKTIRIRLVVEEGGRGLDNDQ